MSKKNQQALENESSAANEQILVTEKKAACRIFALLFLVVSAAALVVLPYNVLSLSEATPLYQVLLDMFSNGFLLDAAEGALNLVYNAAIYAFGAAFALGALISLIVIFSGSRKALKAALILLDLGAIAYTACYFVVAGAMDMNSLILAAGLIIATIICVIATKPKVETIEIEEESEDDGFVVEEYVEAYPYEGGPVAGVVMAQEVNPSFLPHEPHVNTAGYDFYNSKSFDPFISTLNAEERNSFTELFILKYKGTFPELPDYEVGGLNKEFFRKIFIYLGQYRDRIPNDLLGKIYQYSIKL